MLNKDRLGAMATESGEPITFRTSVDDPDRVVIQFAGIIHSMSFKDFTRFTAIATQIESDLYND